MDNHRFARSFQLIQLQFVKDALAIRRGRFARNASPVIFLPETFWLQLQRRI
jgi:hypothetical protein